MSKLLIIGVVVLLVAVAVAGAIMFLGDDNSTGAVTGVPDEIAEEQQVDTALDSGGSGKLSEIKEGMTAAEVIAIAGEPLEKQDVRGLEYWYYEDGSDVYQIAVDGNEVTRVRVY